MTTNHSPKGLISKAAIAMLFGCTALLACKKDDPEQSVPPVGEDPQLTAAKQAAVANHAEIVHASYEDALLTAEVLKAAIDAFVANPTSTGLDDCRLAWMGARVPYGQTEAYRFADGPIDDADGPEGLLNAWPLDEAYVDYVVGLPNAGIINDPVTYPTIDAASLIALNEAGGETNISMGYHAIEFLLWGQDLSVTGPGDRPWTDFTTAPNAARRGLYLKACVEQLVGDLHYLVDAWAPGMGGNYRASFTGGSTNAALKAMLQGIGFLSKGELAGERMFVAFDTQDQENEHSCFSDNTHIDIRMNALGVENVFLGRYQRVDGTVISGTGIRDVLALVNSGQATSTATAITGAKNLCFAIPAPFDQQILSGDQNGPVYQAILALRDAGDQLAQAASRVGLSITVE